jgi:hypothetical protein
MRGHLLASVPKQHYKMSKVIRASCAKMPITLYVNAKNEPLYAETDAGKRFKIIGGDYETEDDDYASYVAFNVTRSGYVDKVNLIIVVNTKGVFRYTLQTDCYKTHSPTSKTITVIKV